MIKTEVDMFGFLNLLNGSLKMSSDMFFAIFEMLKSLEVAAYDCY